MRPLENPPGGSRLVLYTAPDIIIFSILLDFYTFYAAAASQLTIWAERHTIHTVRKAKRNSVLDYAWGRTSTLWEVEKSATHRMFSSVKHYPVQNSAIYHLVLPIIFAGFSSSIAQIYFEFFDNKIHIFSIYAKILFLSNFLNIANIFYIINCPVYCLVHKAWIYDGYISYLVSFYGEHLCLSIF
jgi:hypothetical protein